MAEETKETTPAEEKKEPSKVFKTLGKVLIGLVLIVAGLLACWTWRVLFGRVFLACIGPFLILVGAIFLAIAKE